MIGEPVTMAKISNISVLFPTHLVYYSQFLIISPMKTEICTNEMKYTNQGTLPEKNPPFFFFFRLLSLGGSKAGSGFCDSGEGG